MKSWQVQWLMDSLWQLALGSLKTDTETLHRPKRCTNCKMGGWSDMLIGVDMLVRDFQVCADDVDKGLCHVRLETLWQCYWQVALAQIALVQASLRTCQGSCLSDTQLLQSREKYLPNWPLTIC